EWRATTFSASTRSRPPKAGAGRCWECWNEPTRSPTPTHGGRPAAIAVAARAIPPSAAGGAERGPRGGDRRGGAHDTRAERLPLPARGGPRVPPTGRRRRGRGRGHGPLRPGDGHGADGDGPVRVPAARAQSREEPGDRRRSRGVLVGRRPRVRERPGQGPAPGPLRGAVRLPARDPGAERHPP